ncbi:MAG: aminotransferase class V-fold PLP-dependent enzyme, partial [Planctomycetes bacterium]|nr:aminotransferase class V-fold PLP-dependent enzyme [Planctomycetota bacterium]
WLHSDAVQALPYLLCRVEDLGVDLLSISAHKMCGPKGVGALFVRRRRPRVRLAPLVDGGGHEQGLRSGTLNVPGIVGLGMACEIARIAREEESKRIRVLRDLLLERIRAAVPDAIVNGSMEHRLPNNLSVTFPGVDVNRLLPEIPEVAVSSGAACASTSFDTSYVLQCLGDETATRLGAVRFGLGRFTTRDDVERAARCVADAVRRLRALPPGRKGEEGCAS